MISVMKQFHMLEWLIVQIYMERFAANIVTNIAWNYNKQWTDSIMLLFLVIFFINFTSFYKYMHLRG